MLSDYLSFVKLLLLKSKITKFRYNKIMIKDID